MRRIAAALLIAALAACAPPPPPPPATAAVELDREEREEFRQDLLTDIDKVDIFLVKTRRGTNLTEITLGWFVMILLNELSGHDPGLYAHIHRDDANAEEYLRTNFQSDPAGEIAAMERLAREGESDIRLAVREALACLTSIPDPRSSEEAQRDARTELTASLIKLKRYLTRIAAAYRPDLAIPAGAN
jgi:hypothetical protein